MTESGNILPLVVMGENRRGMEFFFLGTGRYAKTRSVIAFSASASACGPSKISAIKFSPSSEQISHPEPSDRTLVSQGPGVCLLLMISHPP